MNKTILIVGLGNTGKEYDNTRHNAGFMAIDALVNELRITNCELRKKFNSAIVEIKNDPQLADGARIILAKPQTYMNNSGVAVYAIAKFYNILPADIWVVCDDFYLPLGKLRVRELGSSGGHNGMQSIIDHIGTNVFPRFRIGIGPIKKNCNAEMFVLKPVSKADLTKMQTAIGETAQAILCALDYGIKKAMNLYNI